MTLRPIKQMPPLDREVHLEAVRRELRRQVDRLAVLNYAAERIVDLEVKLSEAMGRLLELEAARGPAC